MLVVIVGVCALIVSATLIANSTIDRALLPGLHAVLAQALAVAALAATIAGVATSLLLVRQVLRPLHAIAAGSQRIAAGHYGERVDVPSSDELRAVAVSFNQMAEALEQVEAQRVVLIGNAAHELRTPLAGLEGYIEGVIDGILPDSPHTMELMQHEVRRMRRLVDDLQTLSRVEAGQVELHYRSIDLRDSARRVVDQLQAQVLGANLSLAAQLPSSAVPVRADPDRVAQILLNLVGNAVRYTPEGGQISVKVQVTGELAQVIVTDTGIGIPAEALPYLFERFYRVDPSRSRASGGSGIGLTIAQHLAWAMGGEIQASSPGLGKGSQFILSLPCEQ
jgi:histidine kinase